MLAEPYNYPLFHLLTVTYKPGFLQPGRSAGGKDDYLYIFVPILINLNLSSRVQQ